MGAGADGPGSRRAASSRRRARLSRALAASGVQPSTSATLAASSPSQPTSRRSSRSSDDKVASAASIVARSPGATGRAREAPRRSAATPSGTPRRRHRRSRRPRSACGRSRTRDARSARTARRTPAPWHARLVPIRVSSHLSSVRHSPVVTDGRGPNAPTPDRLRFPPRDLGALDSRSRREATMVGIAQLVEHLVVVQDVAGSSPVTHPKRVRCELATKGPPLVAVRAWPIFFASAAQLRASAWRPERLSPSYGFR